MKLPQMQTTDCKQALFFAFPKVSLREAPLFQCGNPDASWCDVQPSESPPCATAPPPKETDNRLQAGIIPYSFNQWRGSCCATFRVSTLQVFATLPQSHPNLTSLCPNPNPNFASALPVSLTELDSPCLNPDLNFASPLLSLTLTLPQPSSP